VISPLQGSAAAEGRRLRAAMQHQTYGRASQIQRLNNPSPESDSALTNAAQFPSVLRSRKTGRRPMGLAHSDFCWRKAAEYTQRAEDTNDAEVRTFFYRLRDAWIAVANRNEMLDGIDVHVPAAAIAETRASTPYEMY
jgi:hypothetical protein